MQSPLSHQPDQKFHSLCSARFIHAPAANSAAAAQNKLFASENTIQTALALPLCWRNKLAICLLPCVYERRVLRLRKLSLLAQLIHEDWAARKKERPKI